MYIGGKIKAYSVRVVIGCKRFLNGYTRANNNNISSGNNNGNGSNGSNNGEPRKGARVFNADEKKILEGEYKQNKFPTRSMITEFGIKLDKPIEKIRTWFNNRRALDRKQGIDVQRLPNTPRNTTSNTPNTNANISSSQPPHTATTPALLYAQQQHQQHRILQQQAQAQVNAIQAAAKLEITASPASPSPTTNSPPTPPPTISSQPSQPSSSVGLTASMLPLPLPSLTQSNEDDADGNDNMHTHLQLTIKQQQQRSVLSRQNLSAVKQPMPPIALVPETPRKTPQKSLQSESMPPVPPVAGASPLGNITRRMSNVTPISMPALGKGRGIQGRRRIGSQVLIRKEAPGI